MSDQQLSESRVADFAAEIVDAMERDVKLAPVTARAVISTSDAAAIRRRVYQLLLASGARRLGYKVGFTSEAIQAMLGIDEPEFGFLADRHRVSGDTKLPVKTHCQTLIEPEVAFEMGSDLEGSDLSVAEVIEATSKVHASFEIVESRVGLSADFKDVVADNVGTGRIVLASEGMAPRSVDFAAIKVKLEVDGTVYEARANDVLGHPARAVSWLAGRLEALGELGGHIRKGDLIMTGSSVKPVPIGHGSTVSAEFSGLGSLRIEFA